jgi:hypothetical protein
MVIVGFPKTKQKFPNVRRETRKSRNRESTAHIQTVGKHTTRWCRPQGTPSVAVRILHVFALKGHELAYRFTERHKGRCCKKYE